MKFSKLLFSSVVAVSVLGFTAVAAHAEDLLDSVKQAGVLKIGLEGTYPPFDSRNSAGELEGFDVDVAKAVAARLGVKPQFIPTERYHRRLASREIRRHREPGYHHAAT
jgi:cystine transport system substrate-binding protein